MEQKQTLWGLMFGSRLIRLQVAWLRPIFSQIEYASEWAVTKPVKTAVDCFTAGSRQEEYFSPYLPNLGFLIQKAANTLYNTFCACYP